MSEKSDYKFRPSAEGIGLTESYDWFRDPKVLQSFVGACGELTTGDGLQKGRLKILGIGSGLGAAEHAVEDMLRQKGYDTRLIISDISPDVLLEAQKTQDLRIVHDNKNMALPDNSIDLVLARSVTHYEPTLRLERAALAQISDVLKPGGYFVDQAPTLASPAEADLIRNIHLLLPKAMNVQTAEQTEKMLRDFFKVSPANLEHQAKPLPVNKDIFMKRYSIPEDQINELTQKILKLIDAVPQEQRPNVWTNAATGDFGWNIPFTTYKCQIMK